MLIDGQVHGGIAQGIGQALYEQVVYDEDGQLVTGTFVDYALPTAAELPSFETDRTETPSPVNSLGVKGVGEAGTIAASPAVANAVIDALRPLGVTFMDMPLTPVRGVASHRRTRTEVPGMIPADSTTPSPSRSTRPSRRLADGGEDAKLLAGGHSLIPLMKLRLAAPTLLSTCASVPGPERDRARERPWRIGALTRARRSCRTRDRARPGRRRGRA